MWERLGLVAMYVGGSVALVTILEITFIIGFCLLKGKHVLDGRRRRLGEKGKGTRCRKGSR